MCIWAGTNPDAETIREIITGIKAHTEGESTESKHYKTFKQVNLCPIVIMKIATTIVILISPHYDPD
jgi:hypothetical protein